jgi:hypothetical protein
MAKRSKASSGVAGGIKAATGRPTSPNPPPQPGRIDPFFTPEDLAAINDFVTNFSTRLADLDAGVRSLEIDTSYQKGQNDKQAKVSANEATDIMAARGLYRSSVKDAAIYDIEAHRSLANKFLDDKLTEQRLNSGTQKQILADSKTRFDEAMKSKQVQNAQGVNDNSLAAWAERMAAWVPPSTSSKTTPPGAAPAKPAAPIKPQAVQAAYSQSQARNQAAAAVAQAKARKVTAPKPPKPKKLGQ